MHIFLNVSIYILNPIPWGPLLIQYFLGATSIEKITKISVSGRNFLDPLPPLFEKGPTDENVGISYLIVIIKFGFFEIFNPPPYFIRKPNLTDFYNWGGPLNETNIFKSFIGMSFLIH